MPLATKAGVLFCLWRCPEREKEGFCAVLGFLCNPKFYAKKIQNVCENAAQKEERERERR